LYEKEDRLGGRINLAAMIKGTDIENVLPIKTYLTTQLKKLKIKVRLKTTVTRELVMAEKPDVVLVATGGIYTYPNIPGINNCNVVGVKSLSKQVKLPMAIFGPTLLEKLTKLFLPVGKNVVILGGQIEGLQGAIFLRKRGRNVTVLEESDKIGAGIPEKYFIRLPWWFKKRGVKVITGVKYKEVTNDGVVIANKNGRRDLIRGDTVMVLTPQTPDTSTANNLKDIVPEVYNIGSTRGSEAGLLIHALSDARRVGTII
jgi:2,4-dienoyl-CoA reductase (NADPH2)